MESPQKFRYFAVLDFEATCDDKQKMSPQEVIEFPTVLVDGLTMEVVAKFESFVRPVHHPTLSPFCTKLTSITQDMVDGAEEFNAVWTKHQQWLESHGLDLNEPEELASWTFVTCGDWDLRTMLPEQLSASNIDRAQVPRCYTRWINIKIPFTDYSGHSRAPGMDGMLRAMGLTLDGTHHRGVDDCCNTAKILEKLRQSGIALDFTTRWRGYRDWETDRKSTRLNSSHSGESRMPSSA